MEAYPLANDNNKLNCKDVVKVSEILYSSFANPEQAAANAIAFADRVCPKDKTLFDFISRISRFNNDNLSQINTKTETCKAREIQDHYTRGDCEEAAKEKEVCCQGGKICTHLLNFIILLMAAVGNFTGTVGETSWKSNNASIPADSPADEEKTENSFKSFSLRILKKGVKSAGLFRDRTSTEPHRNDDKSSQDNTVITFENNKETGHKDVLIMKEVHKSKKNEIKFTDEGTKVTELSHHLADIALSSMEQSSDSESIHKHYAQTSEDNTDAGGTQQKTPKRKISNLIDSFFKSASVDVESEETGEARWRETVKHLQLEKETLVKENSALQSQSKGLIRENNESKISLERLKKEKENLSREYNQLRVQLDEQQRNTRHRTFMLNSGLERLQHAKLIADQRCLNLSLKQERLVVYEQHVTMICLRVIKTVRKELEDTRTLFDVPKAKSCSHSMANPIWGECLVDGEGLTMFEAHDRLEKEVLELVERYRAITQALTTAKVDETRDENYDEHVMTDNNSTTESGSSCYVVHHHCVCAHDNGGQEFFNLENERAKCERRSRERSFRMGKKIEKRGSKERRRPGRQIYMS